MAYSIRELSQEDFPHLLKEIPDPPKKLFCAGILPDQETKLLCVVGARRYTEYGRDACQKIIAGLSGLPVAIVSGLALGVDSLAHKAALSAGLHTIALPGSGIGPNAIAPRSHYQLAEEIIDAGGALLSEFENDFKATPWSFPKRNRIMAGMSHATLVIEAEKKSGTLITSRLATEYNRDVLTVPGSIFSKNSEGPHMLIRLGATPVTCAEDVMEVLGFKIEDRNQKSHDMSYESLSPDEKKIVEQLNEPMGRDELIRKSGMPAWQLNMILSSLEIQGFIKESMGEIRLN